VFDSKFVIAEFAVLYHVANTTSRKIIARAKVNPPIASFIKTGVFSHALFKFFNIFKPLFEKTKILVVVKN
jgi:hypothetical protein